MTLVNRKKKVCIVQYVLDTNGRYTKVGYEQDASWLRAIVRVYDHTKQ